MLPRGSIYGREPHNHSRLLSLVVTMMHVFHSITRSYQAVFWLQENDLTFPHFPLNRPMS